MSLHFEQRPLDHLTTSRSPLMHEASTIHETFRVVFGHKAREYSLCFKRRGFEVRSLAHNYGSYHRSIWRIDML